MDSATHSNRVGPASLLLMLVLTSCSTPGDRAGGGIDLASAERTSVAVSGETAELCRTVLGYDYPGISIECWQGASSRIWDIASKGRHGLILTRFEIADGLIIRSEVLESREQRGGRVRSQQFLRQFSEAGISDNGALSRHVDSITGATISSKAVADSALLALRLEQNFSSSAGH